MLLLKSIHSLSEHTRANAGLSSRKQTRGSEEQTGGLLQHDSPLATARGQQDAIAPRPVKLPRYVQTPGRSKVDDTERTTGTTGTVSTLKRKWERKKERKLEKGKEEEMEKGEEKGQENYGRRMRSRKKK